MSPSKVWQKLCKAIGLVPSDWAVCEGDPSDGPYQHCASVEALSFSPDDCLLALAGGGSFNTGDGSIRLIDVRTLKNARTLHAHVCGVHDVSFDPRTGVLASASFDYAVHLWNLDNEDVIFLRGEDGKPKGWSKFTRTGSLLAIGEYNFYSGPHSVYVYDLAKQKYVFELELPEEFGVTSLALSPDSAYLAFTASAKDFFSNPSLLYLVQLGTFEVVEKHQFEGFSLSGTIFVGGSDRLLAEASPNSIQAIREPNAPKLIEINPLTGKIGLERPLQKDGITMACSPSQTEVAIIDGSNVIRFFDPDDLNVRQEYFHHGEDARIGSLAYSNGGAMLAFGMSDGTFDILRRDNTGRWVAA